MSQSPAPMMQSSNPMKKKIITALVAVVVGHVGVLWAVGNMKTPELKPVDKDPIKVRFVKIKEEKKPEPPKPKPEPKKEPPKPKEVKIVDKPLPPPPKKVEKVEQVKKKDAPKPTVEAVKNVPPTPVVSTVVSETKVVRVEPKPPAPVSPPPAPPAPPAPPTPKTVSIGNGVSWIKSPNVQFEDGELKASCSVEVAISASAEGKIESATVKNSTCGAAVNRKVTAAVKRARLSKYIDNGVATPTRVDQPFNFKIK